MIGSRTRAWITDHPWMDRIDLRIVSDSGPGAAYAATTIKNGSFVYEKIEDESSAVDPILHLGYGEVDALLEALKQYAKPVDATVDALRDTRDVRDRLLSLVEKRWK